jgi:hypothetical protein
MTYTVSMRSVDEDAQRQPMDARVARRLRELFARLPALAAFRLRTDLMVADVAAVDESNGNPIWRLHVCVTQALVELAECEPEALALMRGRTFER